MTALDALLDVQRHDTVLDQLHHEHASLPERSAVAEIDARLAEIQERLDAATAERNAVLHDEKRLDDEASSIEAKAADAEKKLFSGVVTSPKELQALQADVDSLRKHRAEVEDQELEVMERREEHDLAVAVLEAERVEHATQRDAALATLTERENAIDVKIAAEASARRELAAEIDGALLAEYERRRAQAKGVGVARMVGPTCQGCHISLPSTEVERIRHAAADALNFCDNCGCILVVST